MGKKYQISIRMWVKQTDKLYDSMEEGLEAAKEKSEKLDIPLCDIKVEEAN